MREVLNTSIPVDRREIRFSGRPVSMPTLEEGEVLVCEFIRNLELPSFNKVYICETVEDIQQLFDICARGGAMLLNWYVTTELVAILTGEAIDNWRNPTK